MADLLELDRAKRRQLEAELTQLQSEGYSRDELVGYVKGFKEGYTAAQPFGALGKVAQGAPSRRPMN